MSASTNPLCPEPCVHLVLKRIVIVGLVRYECSACGKIFEVPAAETIVITHG